MATIRNFGLSLIASAADERFRPEGAVLVAAA
jgi:hypothetical protein